MNILFYIIIYINVILEIYKLRNYIFLCLNTIYISKINTCHVFMKIIN